MSLMWFALVATCGLILASSSEYLQSPDALMRIDGHSGYGKLTVRFSANDSRWYDVCFDPEMRLENTGDFVSSICKDWMGLNVSWAELTYYSSWTLSNNYVQLDCENETLTNCTFTPVSHCYFYSIQWLLYCPSTQSQELSLRLTGGEDKRRGLLEVFIDGGWTTVCKSGFGVREAQVVCRQLGFTVDRLRPKIYASYMYQNRKIMLRNVDCMGNESRLIDCDHVLRRQSNCGQRVLVECPLPNDYTARLTGGSNSTRISNGRLDIEIAGRWKSLFGQVNTATARVACRQMGLPSAYTRVYPDPLSAGFNESWTKLSISCTGTETHLSECPIRHIFYTPFTSATRVVCSDIPDYQVRLVGGTNHSGRVEVNIGQIWGTVCSEFFGIHTPTVVCKQLGISSNWAHSAKTTDYGAAIPSQIIWLSHVTCTGHESSLKYCNTEQEGYNDCTHADDLAVTCESIDPTHLSIRLVDGRDENFGRLEVNVNGEWGTVCDDSFNSNAAKVVCRQLGLPHQHALYFSASASKYSPGTGQIFLDDVSCSGDETNIGLCRHDPIGQENCNHVEDVAVECRASSMPDYSLRLTGGDDERSGRLEVNIDGEWGTVCNDHFDHDAAKVVCDQLGFTDSWPKVDTDVYHDTTSLPILLDDVICLGYESKLEACSHRPVGLNDCTHREDVYIKCQKQVNPLAIAGGIVGSLALIVILSIMYCYCRKRSGTRSNSLAPRSGRRNQNQAVHYTVNLQYNNTSGTLTTSSHGSGAMIVQPSAPGTYAGPPSYSQLFPNGGKDQEEPLRPPSYSMSEMTPQQNQQHSAQDNPVFQMPTENQTTGQPS